MDLSGHSVFRQGATSQSAGARIGLSLLATGWSALASGRVETISVQLRSGTLIDGVLAIRMDGLIAEASTRAGHYTHAFAVDEVVMVKQVPRGG
ncbi:MAG: hypothetical protein DI568_07070 [Sphingomonas sp.]|nr:MAG: hypothetical protein DI568_07070 [Sphingomonas sp.]